MFENFPNIRKNINKRTATVHFSVRTRVIRIVSTQLRDLSGEFESSLAILRTPEEESLKGEPKDSEKSQQRTTK